MPKASKSDDEHPAAQQARAIVAELEQRTHADIDAMNRRDFSPTSPLHYLKTENWRSQIIEGMGMRQMTLDQYIRKLIQLTKENPEWKARVLDMTTTVNAKKDYAQMYVNIELEGMPPGIVRQSLAINVWRLIHGIWFSCSNQAMAGQDGRPPFCDAFEGSVDEESIVDNTMLEDG